MGKMCGKFFKVDQLDCSGENRYNQSSEQSKVQRYTIFLWRNFSTPTCQMVKYKYFIDLKDR